MKEADERESPFFFQKPTDAIVQDGATVLYPPDTTDFQFEVELVAAIRLDGQDIDVASANDHILGYAVGIELTRRDRQRKMREKMLPWERGRSFDFSAPCGPLQRMQTVAHGRPKVAQTTYAIEGPWIDLKYQRKPVWGRAQRLRSRPEI